MRILFLEVAKPRHQVGMSLQASDQEQIAKVTLLATLRSLDIMQDIQKLNYINHPSVSKELVKFLSVNTEFQSVKDLKETSAEHNASINELKKEVAGSVRTLGTVGNKCKNVQKEVVALFKRVKDLEK